MKRVDPKVYDEHYYLDLCLGSDQFKKTNGAVIHDRLQNLLSKVTFNSKMKVLDVGCGRGDVALFVAQKVKETVGIDYSKAGIAIAKRIQKKAPASISRKIKFFEMDIKTLNFPDNYFDVIICIDVIEHLYKDETEIALQELSRVLKKNGVLFIHTGPNKLLYDYVYPWFIWPMNQVITRIDQLIKGKTYQPLPKQPRTQAELEQHVNEPTYFYLQDLFKRHHFSGEIEMEVGFRKEGWGLRTHLYNFFVTLYPVSNIFLLKIFFSWIFIAYLRSTK